MNRPCRCIAFALVLASLSSLTIAPSVCANPIAPSFFATTGSQLVDIYLNVRGAPETWTWFGMPECALPQADSITATAMTLGNWNEGAVVSGTRKGASWSGTAAYTTQPWSCAARTPLVDVHHLFSGLVSVNGTNYGIGWADPPATAGTASLWTLDPLTGSVGEVGSLGSAVADQIVSGLTANPNDQSFYTLACCPGPLGEVQDDFVARIDPMSGHCTGTWRVLSASGAPMSYLRSIEWIGGDMFVSIGPNGDELYLLVFVAETSPPGPGHWRATRITAAAPGEVTGLVELSWTGWDAPYPAKTTTWGGLKARYR